MSFISQYDNAPKNFQPRVNFGLVCLFSRVGGGDTKKDLFLQITLATLKPQNLTFSKDNCVESIKKSQKFETCRTFEV